MSYFPPIHATAAVTEYVSLPPLSLHRWVVQVLFKQFFSTAVLGLGHGLILLPVLLSLVGPDAYRYVYDRYD